MIIKGEGNEANLTYITVVRAESGLRRHRNELEPTEAMSLKKENEEEQESMTDMEKGCSVKFRCSSGMLVRRL